MTNMRDNKWRFAIVGGGLTAVSMLIAFVRRIEEMKNNGLRTGKNIEVNIYEKQYQIGPGLPHSDQFTLPFHITNMCANDMSVVRGIADDYQNWVRDNAVTLSADYSGLFDKTACPQCELTGGGHYPRSVMGRYLKARMAWATQRGRSLGLNVNLHAGVEVTNLKFINPGERVFLETSDKNTCGQDYDQVLLATGHWFPLSDIPGYFPSPWPAQRLSETIPTSQTVGILGSSLSAIEVALTLTADGRFVRTDGKLKYLPSGRTRKLVFHSRSGMLPNVRGRIGTRVNRFLTLDKLKQLISEQSGGLRLQGLYELLNAELIDAYGSEFKLEALLTGGIEAFEKLRSDIQKARVGDAEDGSVHWQTVICQVFPLAREIYLGLAPSERVRFDRKFGTLFFMHAATQPLINAEKILALHESGVLDIETLGSKYIIDHKEYRHTLIYSELGGKKIEKKYRYLVNATGQPRDNGCNPAALMKNLITAGHLVFESNPPSVSSVGNECRVGSLKVDPESHRVLEKRNGKITPSRSIFAVGAMTRNQMIDVSMAAGLVRSTDEIARQLVNELVTDDTV